MKKNDPTFAHASNETCLSHVIQAYKEVGSGMTLRHYYYKLLSCGAIRLLPNTKSADNAYKFASRLLTDARQKGLLPWYAVIDPGRRSFTHDYYYRSLEEYVKAESRSAYSLNVWTCQPYNIEVWVEKDAMAEFMNNIVDDLRIPVHVAKGYGSATIVQKAAKRYGDGKDWVLLYCGDFDPSGLDIQRSLQDELAAHGAFPTIIRVTLTQEDTFNLPPQAALELKEGDSRTKAFKKKYGEQQKGFELDALPAAELKRRLMDAINTYMDMEAFEAAIELEESIKEEAADRLEKAMKEFEEDMLENGAPGSTLSLEKQLLYLKESAA